MNARQRVEADWQRDLPGLLKSFADQWLLFEGTEQQGAQDFLRRLLDLYDVKFTPGTIFEQHPVRFVPRSKPAAQGSLFGEEPPPTARPTMDRMDMYLPKVCVWEMKSPSEKDLGKWHGQLLGYWSHVRTRYMVLCNFREFWIYDTNDEDGQLAPKLMFKLEDLAAHGDALLFLRGEEPELASRAERVTADVAGTLGRLVRDLIAASDKPERDRERIAKFVLECVFAMFAEDTDLIPAKMFTNVAKEARDAGRIDPVWSLFDDFANDVSIERKRHKLAPYVNGPLFDKKHPRLSLEGEQLDALYEAANRFDWKDVRPEIFGSIFEQALSHVERHELGAHFTREADIMRVVMPTVIEPWRERIATIRTPKDAERVVEQMRNYHVLDPACGCGNFLYVVYREMKRLECALARKWTEIQKHTAKRRSSMVPPPAQPYFTLDQVHGIEKSAFAATLARVVLWVGEHLANRELALDEATLPLRNLDKQVRNDDALEVDWPRPEGELAIVGNPPYLGVRKMREVFGDKYVEEIFERFPKNRAADYVTYWFTRALGVLRPGEHAGFVCTNSIAQNESREASIDQIVAKGGTITDAWKSYPWPGEAAVHIGIVNWLMAPYDGIKMLDGHEVSSISPSLTEAVDVTTARRLDANRRLCFQGVTPGNEGFILDEEQRRGILESDPKSEPVIRPHVIGRDINRDVEQRPTRWIIDFALMSKDEAEQFPGAMRHVRRYVYPVRKENRREIYSRNWWRFVEARPGLREAIDNLSAVLVIPRVSPHLIVSRKSTQCSFDGQLMVIALSAPFHFGILQSATHSVWAWARGHRRQPLIAGRN